MASRGDSSNSEGQCDPYCVLSRCELGICSISRGRGTRQSNERDTYQFSRSAVCFTPHWYAVTCRHRSDFISYSITSLGPLRFKAPVLPAATHGIQLSEKSKKAYQTLRLVMHLYEVTIPSESGYQQVIRAYIPFLTTYQLLVCMTTLDRY